jgi:hypothetical protein
MLRPLEAETAFGPRKQRGGKGGGSKWTFEEGYPKGEPAEGGRDTVERTLVCRKACRRKGSSGGASLRLETARWTAERGGSEEARTIARQ